MDPALAAELRALGYDPDDPDLESRLVEEQARDLEWLDQVQVHYPLACSQLWRAEAPETGWDQRRAAMLVLTALFVVLIKGGNRSGKSRAAIEVLIVLALGRDHPVTQRWCEVNDIDPALIPEGPATVVAVAKTHDDSILYHRPVFRELLGSLPCVWHREDAHAPARCVIRVPGHRRPGRILFRAVQQGREAAQGFSARAVWVDEEPLGVLGQEVVNELKMRVVDQKGKVVITYAALEGLTWMHQRYEVEGRDHVQIAELDALDNPYLPTEHMRDVVYDGMSEDEIASRRFGRARSKQGAIYPMFSPGDHSREGPGHLCRPFPIPPEWPRVWAGDFGLTNPTALGWGALGDDDTLYVYAQWYRGNNASYEAIAEQVAPFHRAQNVSAGWGDPSADKARAAFAAAGMPLEPADNTLTTGYDAVRERLRVLGDGRPRLKIFDTCPDVAREMAGLVWDPKRVDRVQLKVDDHAADMLRYMVVGVDSWIGQRRSSAAVVHGTSEVLRRLSLRGRRRR